MKILFLTRLYWPHVGGVEKQVAELSKRLLKRGHSVTILTERYNNNLKPKEKVEGVNVIRLKYPKIRFFGLIYIWLWIFIHIRLIAQSDIVHTHGVFVWYWPFCFFLLKKPAYTTFHGWEGIYPIPWKNKMIRKIDVLLARKNITISDYVEKYYGIKADEISYTAVDVPKNKVLKKDKKRLVYIGRLDEDTGLPLILKALSHLRGLSVDFCGDGPLRKACEKYGKVHGFTDPDPYLTRSFICLSPGVTSILEALAYRCLIITTYNNPLKKDYLLMTPFSKWIIVEVSPTRMADKIKYFVKNPEKAKSKIDKAHKWVQTQNWENETDKYLRLWGVK
jgi:glycosyltransferase involved in cell wall biosynthesis